MGYFSKYLKGYGIPKTSLPEPLLKKFLHLEVTEGDWDTCADPGIFVGGVGGWGSRSI